MTAKLMTDPIRNVSDENIKKRLFPLDLYFFSACSMLSKYPPCAIGMINIGTKAKRLINPKFSEKASTQTRKFKSYNQNKRCPIVNMAKLMILVDCFKVGKSRKINPIHPNKIEIRNQDIGKSCINKMAKAREKMTIPWTLDKYVGLVTFTPSLF